MVCQFYWWRKPEYRKNPPTCRKSLTIFITWYCIEYTSPCTGFELATLVVIGTDCTGSCKSNYHTITTTTVQYDKYYDMNWTYGHINIDNCSWYWLYCLTPLVYLLPQTCIIWRSNLLNYVRIWWRLNQKHVLCTNVRYLRFIA
jgi:hypothetical protein